MFLRNIILVVAAWTVADGTFMVLLHGQDATPESRTLTLYDDDVSSRARALADRIAEPDAVLRCRVLGGEVKVSRDPAYRGVDPKYGIKIVIDQRIEILEILKAHPKLLCIAMS